MPEMPHDELRNAANAIVARLQSDFDAHLSQLDELHTKAREDALRQAETRASEEWTARFDAERGEWQRRLEAALADARAEAERACKRGERPGQGRGRTVGCAVRRARA